VLPGGQILIESMAIIEYLEEVYPESPLLPKDPVLRAQIRGFCEVINSGLHPYQNLRCLEKVGRYPNADKVEWAKDWVVRGF
jgi:glutathione S-transferase